MGLKLESTVSSAEDLKGLILEVREYAKWYAHDAIKRRVSKKGAINQPELSDAARAVIKDWQKENQLGTASLDKLVMTLEDFESTAPRLSITLAAPVPGNLKKNLVSWCRDNVAPNVLVSFQINSSLLGGMVVRYGSRMFDWSFRRQILEHRMTFPEILRNA